MKDSDIWKDAKFLLVSFHSMYFPHCHCIFYLLQDVARPRTDSQTQKLVIKEYNKMSGEDEQVDVVNDGRENASRDAANEEGDDGGKKKNKNKPPNMNRLVKSRLQKLVNKTDES